MKAIVVKRLGFDAAHRLPNYKGKCANLHGHHWIIDVGLAGEVDKFTGMVVDFSWISKAMDPLIECFDHHCLNDTITNPTAENITRYVYDYLRDNWIQSPQEPVQLEFVRVWESEDSYAEVRGE